MLFQAEKQGISLNPRKKPGPAATANKKGLQKDGKFSLPRPTMRGSDEGRYTILGDSNDDVAAAVGARLSPRPTRV